MPQFGHNPNPYESNMNPYRYAPLFRPLDQQPYLQQQEKWARDIRVRVFWDLGGKQVFSGDSTTTRGSTGTTGHDCAASSFSE